MATSKQIERYQIVKKQYTELKGSVGETLWRVAMDGDFVEYEEMAMQFAKFVIVYAQISSMLETKGEM